MALNRLTRAMTGLIFIYNSNKKREIMHSNLNGLSSNAFLVPYFQQNHGFRNWWKNFNGFIS